MTTFKSPKKSLKHLPHTATFKALFIAAAKKYPGLHLGYTGTSLSNGDNYMQERGNPEPFIVTDNELQSALSAD
ncbi:hypothetical protein ACLS0R_07475 [Comamonas jiangduensis]|uniref:hypothetical protein n=1 Tax=Comamonas jiangduensis TaxID=1194168 RepID=UPI003BF81E88